jgi:hypothetical protein
MRSRQVALSVDLRDVSLGVAQDQLGRFEPVPRSNFCSASVP